VLVANQIQGQDCRARPGRSPAEEKAGVGAGRRGQGPVWAGSRIACRQAQASGRQTILNWQYPRVTPRQPRVHKARAVANGGHIQSFKSRTRSGPLGQTARGQGNASNRRTVLLWHYLIQGSNPGQVDKARSAPAGPEKGEAT
jgi:hypothetical protein